MSRPRKHGGRLVPLREIPKTDFPWREIITDTRKFYRFRESLPIKSRHVKSRCVLCFVNGNFILYREGKIFGPKYKSPNFVTLTFWLGSAEISSLYDGERIEVFSPY